MIDLNDWTSFADCVTGPNATTTTACDSADMDADLDVDLFGQALFREHFGTNCP